MLNNFLTIIIYSLLSTISPIAFCADQKERLLIDCDMGLGQYSMGDKKSPSDIDDAYAILSALKSSKIDVLGITTVFGNTDIKSATKSLKDLLSKGKFKIPIVEGAEKSSSRENPCPKGAKKAAQFLSKFLNHPTSIMSIGPLSNISCLVHHYPDKIKNIKNLFVVMGRSKGVKFKINRKSVRDFNFESDPVSVEKIINTGLHITYFPFELTRQSLISKDKIVNLSLKNNIWNFLGKSSLEFINYWNSIFNEEGFHPWDSAPVAYLEQENLFHCEKRKFVIIKDKKIKLIALKSNLNEQMGLFCNNFTSLASKKKFEKKVISI